MAEDIGLRRSPTDGRRRTRTGPSKRTRGRGLYLDTERLRELRTLQIAGWSDVEDGFPRLGASRMRPFAGQRKILPGTFPRAKSGKTFPRMRARAERPMTRPAATHKGLIAFTSHGMFGNRVSPRALR